MQIPQYFRKKEKGREIKLLFETEKVFSFLIWLCFHPARNMRIFVVQNFIPDGVFCKLGPRDILELGPNFFQQYRKQMQVSWSKSMKIGSWLCVFQHFILKVLYPKRDQRTTHFGSQDKYSRIKLHHVNLKGKRLRFCKSCYLQYI